MLEGLAPFFRERKYPNGGVIFRKGATAHSIYFITSGEVTLWAPRFTDGVDDERSGGGSGSGSGGGSGGGERELRSRKSVVARSQISMTNAGSAEDSAFGRRLVRYADGGIFGELDFFLRHP